MKHSEEIEEQSASKVGGLLAGLEPLMSGTSLSKGELKTFQAIGFQHSDHRLTRSHNRFWFGCSNLRTRKKPLSYCLTAIQGKGSNRRQVCFFSCSWDPPWWSRGKIIKWRKSFATGKSHSFYSIPQPRGSCFLMGRGDYLKHWRKLWLSSVIGD